MTTWPSKIWSSNLRGNHRFKTINANLDLGSDLDAQLPLASILRIRIWNHQWDSRYSRYIGSIRNMHSQILHSRKNEFGVRNCIQDVYQSGLQLWSMLPGWLSRHILAQVFVAIQIPESTANCLPTNHMHAQLCYIAVDSSVDISIVNGFLDSWAQISEAQHLYWTRV